MTRTITATEAVRKFSEILNSIRYTGDEYTVMRGGKPVASIRPAGPHAKAARLGDLAELLGTLPALGVEADLFRKDLEAARKRQPRLPEKRAWE